MSYLRRVLMILSLLIFSSVSAQDTTITRQPITAENARELTELFTLEHNLTSLPNLQWSPNGRWMTASGLGGIYLYDLNPPRRSQPIDRTPLLLQDGATFSPDGRLLATAGVDFVVIWDMITGEQLDVWVTPYPVAEMRFSPDGTVLAMTVNGQVPTQNMLDVSTVYLWDVNTGEQYGSVGYYDLINRGLEALPFVFSADGESLLTIDADVVAQWDYREPQNTRPAGLMLREDLLDILLENYVFAPVDARIYQWIAYQNDLGTFALWLTDENGESLFTTQDGDVSEVISNQSGADFDQDGIPQVIDGYTRLTRAVLIPALSTLGDLIFETFDEPVMIVNRNRASAVVPRYGYNEDANTITDRSLNLVFEGIEQSGVGRYVSSLGDVLLQRYYTLDATALEPEILYTLADVDDMRFTDNGNLLVVRSSDDVATVELIDLSTGDVIFESTLSLWDAEFDGVAISPDESILVYGFYDDQTDLRGYNLIDMETGRGITSLPYAGDAVTFNHDGSLLVFRSVGLPLSFWGISE